MADFKMSLIFNPQRVSLLLVNLFVGTFGCCTLLVFSKAAGLGHVVSLCFGLLCTFDTIC